MKAHLVVVPHTHWDREWYRTREQFRLRLVRLLDRVLALLEADPAFRHFTLDGQSIILQDYLEVRPEARERISRLVSAGRLLVGPWFVLPDEWLVSGEALLRNLRLGLAQARELGGSMRLGYVPDQFGHVGQLPQLFAGFGFDAAVLWRGVGREVGDTTFTWEGADGTRLFTVYLRHGYGNATNLPEETAAAAARLGTAARALARESRVASLLLMHGSDHAEPHPRLPEVVERLRRDEPDWEVEIGTLADFVAHARATEPEPPALHRGELRSGLRAPLLPGCASARLPQKQADFRNDRLLSRYLEPLAAWLQVLGGDADPAVIDLAWRVALENHPHDSICGCSVDAVHDEMELRFRRVEEIAHEHLTRVQGELNRRVARPEAAAGDLDSLLVWNPGGAGAAQVECELSLRFGARAPLAPALHLRDASGVRHAAHVERSFPGRLVARQVFPRSVMQFLLAGLGPELHGLHVWALRARRAGSRIRASAALAPTPPPPGAFDLEAARRRAEALLSDPESEEVELEIRELPRYRLRFVDRLPAHGLRVYALARGPAGSGDEGAASLVAEPGEHGGARIANESWSVEVDGGGRVELSHAHSGVRVPDALRLVSEGDRGDTYNFDAVPAGPTVSSPERVRVALEGSSQAEVTVRIDARYRVPLELESGRVARSRRCVSLPVRVRLRLARGLDRLDVAVELENTARDHRLRLHLRAPFEASGLEVESAFEVTPRPIAPAPDAFGGPFAAERPAGACPQRAFATLLSPGLALTVSSRGSSEVEAVPEGERGTELALTLLRAVGWLSRSDLVSRPGPAGPELATPGAQVPGPHAAHFALHLHPPGDSRRAARAHAHAYPPLAWVGGHGGGPLRDGARLLEVDDPEVLVSAVEPRRDGGPLLRLVNLSPSPRRLRVRWTGGGSGRLIPVSLGLDEGVACATRFRSDQGVLELRPYEIACLRVP